MKHLTLLVVFTVICSALFAQTKRTDTTKKTTANANAANTKTLLVQEKIWPLYDPKNKSKDTVILKPRPLGRMRIRI